MLILKVSVEVLFPEGGSSASLPLLTLYSCLPGVEVSAYAETKNYGSKILLASFEFDSTLSIIWQMNQLFFCRTFPFLHRSYIWVS